MLGNRLPAPVYQMEGMFTVIFKRPIVTAVENSGEPVEKRWRKPEINLKETWKKPEINLEETLLSLLKQKPAITIIEMAMAINQSRGIVEYKLNSLKLKGLIKRMGSNKSGHWRIVSDTIKKETVEETVKETVKETVEETVEEKILTLIRQKPAITAKEIEKEINLTHRGVEYHISSLKTKGIIERVGPTKGGHWRTLPKTN